jgi:hypothetical protein
VGQYQEEVGEQELCCLTQFPPRLPWLQACLDVEEAGCAVRTTALLTIENFLRPELWKILT